MASIGHRAPLEHIQRYITKHVSLVGKDTVCRPNGRTRELLMNRRNFLLGAGSATIGGTALLGSGAFTRAQSQRRMKIDVADDWEHNVR